MCKGCDDNEQLRLNPGLKLANAFGVIPTDSGPRSIRVPGATRFALAPGFHIPRLWRYFGSKESESLLDKCQYHPLPQVGQLSQSRIMITIDPPATAGGTDIYPSPVPTF